MDKKLVISFFSLTLFLVAFFGAPVQGAINAVGIEAPAEVIVGIEFQVKLTGLTVGSNYRVDAAHSDGNISRVISATSSTEYVGLIFKTEDADGIVPIHIGSADSAGALSGATTATALVQVKSPSDSLDSSFFLLVLTPLLIIGIVFAIVKRFIRS